jgi:hypothetical protein
VCLAAKKANRCGTFATGQLPTSPANVGQGNIRFAPKFGHGCRARACSLWARNTHRRGFVRARHRDGDDKGAGILDFMLWRPANAGLENHSRVRITGEVPHEADRQREILLESP